MLTEVFRALLGWDIDFSSEWCSDSDLWKWWLRKRSTYSCSLYCLCPSPYRKIYNSTVPKAFMESLDLCSNFTPPRSLHLSWETPDKGEISGVGGKKLKWESGYYRCSLWVWEAFGQANNNVRSQSDKWMQVATMKICILCLAAKTKLLHRRNELDFYFVIFRLTISNCKVKQGKMYKQFHCLKR